MVRDTFSPLLVIVSVYPNIVAYNKTRANDYIGHIASYMEHEIAHVIVFLAT